MQFPSYCWNEDIQINPRPCFCFPTGCCCGEHTSLLTLIFSPFSNNATAKGTARLIKTQFYWTEPLHNPAKQRHEMNLLQAAKWFIVGSLGEDVEPSLFPPRVELVEQKTPCSLYAGSVAFLSLFTYKCGTALSAALRCCFSTCPLRWKYIWRSLVNPLMQNFIVVF